MTEPPTAGEWLRERLADAGLMPKQLAARLDIAPKRVYDWLRGDGVPNDDNARLIAEQIGVSETELRLRFGMYVSPEALDILAARRRLAVLREAAKTAREREAFDEIARVLASDRNRDLRP